MIIREAVLEDARAIAHVRVASWRTTYRGKLPKEYLEAMDIDTYTGAWEGILQARGAQGYTYVAEDVGGQIKGFAVGGWNRTEGTAYQGELYAIYLLKEAQRGGTGRRLAGWVAQRLQREGFNSMMVWVMADNPARRFYQKLGGRFVMERESFIGGTRVREVAYGWEDLLPLIGGIDGPTGTQNEDQRES